MQGLFILGFAASILGLGEPAPQDVATSGDVGVSDLRTRAALRLEYVPGELVVKLRSPVAAHAESAVSQSFTSAEESIDAPGLDALVDEYGIVALRRVFRRFDEKSDLVASAQETAAANAERHPARSGRAPLGATVPDLENIFVAELAEGSDVLDAAARFSSHPDVVYAEPNVIFRTALTPLPDLPFVPDDRFLTQDGAHWSEGAWGQNFPDLYGLESLAAIEGWNLFDTDDSGSLASELITEAFDYAHALGAISIAAAGNSDTDVDVFSPANLDTVVAVAAIDHEDRRASFSNFGAAIEISAPGVDVLSLNANGGDNPIALAYPDRVVETDYLILSGTSMACPHVAGAVAVLMSRYPDAPVEEIRGRLLAGARSIAPSNPEFANLLGTGKVDLFGSLVADPRPMIRVVEASAGLYPGRQANLVVHLENSWLSARGVVATLTTANPFVTILDDTGAFGDIPIAESRSNSADPFVVSVAADAPFSERIDFELHWSDLDGYAETLGFTVEVSFFQNVLGQTGLPKSDLLPFHIAMHDYDADGATDVHFIGFTAGDLYHNRGDGSFENVTEEAGTEIPGMPMKTVFADVDRDGDTDLFAMTNGASKSRLFFNVGG
ncbi:S8 family serine peptidase, partial [bacterium]|nr:S8 family serine peptidase [bacterium]